MERIKVLQVHNEYNVSGGEDSVARAEYDLLSQSTDYDVDRFYVDNKSIVSFWDKARVALGTVWSKSYERKISELIDKSRPEIMHVHNFFPRLSPSIFYAAKKKGVSTVLTLHNYRTICPTSLLMYDGKVCERSIDASAYWAVPKKVYRDSSLGTFALASMIEFHKKIGTWQKYVDRFVCLTEFSKQKFIEAGFPESKIYVKPNFCSNLCFDVSASRDGAPVYVGRLSVEKGISVLSKSAQYLNSNVLLVGEGEFNLSGCERLVPVGRMEHEDVLDLIGKSPFLILPSICYEGFPMAIVEAFSKGTPVVCSNIGSMAKIVRNGVNGMLFEVGNAHDLAEKINWMLSNPEKVRLMGVNARREYERKYTAEKNMNMLGEVYNEAIRERRSV